MKTLFKMAAAAALFAATMLAERPANSSTPPDPAAIVAHRVDRLTRLLGLSTSQASQATTIFTNSQNAIMPLETSLHANRQSMQNAVKANDLATIDSVAANIGTLTGQIAGIHNKADASFYAILNPSQQSTLDQSGVMAHGAGRGFAGHGPLR